MKDFRTWLIIGLTAIVIYLIISRPSKLDSQTIVTARDSISQLLEANVTHSMQVKTLETRLVETQVKSRSDSARFIREITVKNQQLARKRVQIDTVFKDSPVLQSYLQTVDSVFAMMRERIDTLEASKAFTEGLYTDLIRIKDKEIQNLTYISTQQNVIIRDQEKALRKRNRGNKLMKVLAVTGAVGGLLLGSQL